MQSDPSLGDPHGSVAARESAPTASESVALIDDHEMVEHALLAAMQPIPKLRLVATYRTVDELLASRTEAGLVILDLRLADGSSPAVNIRRLRAHGAKVLAYTSGESPYLTRLALRSDVLGIVRKSEPIATLTRAIEQASAGIPVVTASLAHAIQSDPRVGEAELSPQETRILTMFADGARSTAIADELHITVGTLESYLGRIRRKYSDVGRPAPTKVDLYKRAVEDGLLPTPGRP